MEQENEERKVGPNEGLPAEGEQPAEEAGTAPGVAIRIEPPTEASNPPPEEELQSGESVGPLSPSRHVEFIGPMERMGSFATPSTLSRTASLSLHHVQSQVINVAERSRVKLETGEEAISKKLRRQ